VKPSILSFINGLRYITNLYEDNKQSQKLQLENEIAAQKQKRRL
jgi:hypothetical protein